MTKQETYDESNIQSLSQRDSIRKRPAMYIGSVSSNQGINQLIFELIDNVIDEYSNGFGDILNLTIYKDNSVQVEDNARGIPCGPHPTWKNADGSPKNTLIGMLTTIHAGGKFNNEIYKYSSGTHGIGATAVQYLSNYFNIIVNREGKKHYMEFNKGIPLYNDVKILEDTDKTGTIIHYLPDDTIFKNTIEPSNSVILNRLRELSALNSGLKIHYINEKYNEDITLLNKNGLSEYLENMVGDNKPIINKPINFTGEYINKDDINKDIVKVELYWTHDDNINSHQTFKTFVNDVSVKNGGTPVNGFKKAYKKLLNEYAKKNKLIKDDIELKYLLDNIYCIINVKISNPEFEGQTKNALNNVEAEYAVEDIMEKQFNKFVKTNKSIIDIIINKSIDIKQAEEAARKAKINARLSKKATKVALPGKLSDCTYNSGYREILLCEGDSASGAAKQGRNRLFQAVLALRGKVKNAEKSDFESLMDSEIIRNIISSIGTGIGKHFNINKLRYDKIIMLCFTGDTRVKLLNGTNPTFEELVEMEKQNPGQNYWVYSRDNNNKIVPGRGFNPRVIKQTNKLLKLSFNDG